MPRFAMPKAPCDFEVPDDWWAEAGMASFEATANCYFHAGVPAVVPLVQIEPPTRNPDVRPEWRGFDRPRLISVLNGIAAGAELPPVPLQVIANGHDFPPAPFIYRVRDGFHRFYASIAAGFTHLPAEYV
jgi:hypothetical protein